MSGPDSGTVATAGWPARKAGPNVQAHTRRDFGRPAMPSTRAVERLRPFFEELGLDLPSKPDAGAVWPSYAQQVEALLDARPAVFSFVFGIPAPDVLSRCQQLGIVTIGAATTPHEARLLEDAGVDMVVATGSDAGGHRVSFTDAPQHLLTGTFSLVPQICAAVRIPVIAAGGIADARGVRAAMALGADAVQIGTAFLACGESNAGHTHQQALHAIDQPGTTLTRGFSGRLSRGLRNRLTIELEQAEQDILPYPWQNWLTGILKRAAIAQHRSDLMSLWGCTGCEAGETYTRSGIDAKSGPCIRTQRMQSSAIAPRSARFIYILSQKVIYRLSWSDRNVC